MVQEEDLELYRSQLLDSMSERPSHSVRGLLDPIQVYVNERRVGELKGAETETTLHVHGVDHIETVQLRTEDGRLLGGLVAPESGFRTNRVRLSHDTVELCVQNTAQGGSLSAVFMPAPSFWSRTWNILTDVADRWMVKRPEAAMAYGMRTVAFTQVLLAIAVVGLVADRVMIWITPEHTVAATAQAEALRTASITEIEQLAKQLRELRSMQTKVGDALQSQEKGMTLLHQTMARLSSTQESVASSVVMVKEEMEKRQEGPERDADRPAQLPAGKGLVDQDQFEVAIHGLAADNERLSKQIAGLEEHNRTLTAKLQTAIAHVAKAVEQSPERLVAREVDIARKHQLVPVVDSRQGTQAQPFLFWVTFSEGTTQESIDQWVNGMKGHKGAQNEGWQEVQILPPPVPPDLFLEQLRGDKIIKEARLNH
jgi:chaperonin cofactor prefoldin